MPSRKSSKELSTRLSNSPDWLPPVRPNLLMPNSRVGQFVDKKKGSHWFLCFADAMYEGKSDYAQGKMLAKAYAFLYDFMPSGLTGRWSHIDGQDLMNILMSQTSDTSVSRHKASAAAQSSFNTIEAWMTKATSWKEAAQFDQDKPNGTKEKGIRKAPVLYSPAGLLAVLIISYPDRRIRNWIGILQIDWMMRPHDTLDIRKGFWKGITKADLGLFDTEEPRNAEVPLLADYSSLLGRSFVRARRDIRPFVPEWARNIALKDDLSGDEDSSDVDNNTNTLDPTELMPAGDGHRADSEPVHALSALEKHLHPSHQASAEDLQDWLARKLTSCGEEDVLMFWCKHWASRTEEMPDYESQLLVRSLFLDSIRRLQGLSGSAHTASTDALMLLDIEDGRDRSKDRVDPALVTTIQRVEEMPAHKPLLDARAQLLELAHDTESRSLLEAAFEGQMCFLLELLHDERFHEHEGDVVDLDTARIKILLRAVTRKDVEETPTADPSDGPAFNLNSVSALKLSRWQMRALAVSSPQTVLTAWQSYTHRSRGQIVGIASVDLSQFGLAPVAEIADGSGLSPERRQILRELFGDLSKAPVAGSQQRSSVATTSLSEPLSSPPLEQVTPKRDSFAVHSPAKPNGTAQASERVQTEARAGTDKPWHNPFRSARVAKRASSPDARGVKMPRLVGTTAIAQDAIDELRGDVKNVARDVEQLKNMARDNDQLKNVVRDVGQLKTALSLLKDELLEFAEVRSEWVCDQVTKRLAKAGEHSDANQGNVPGNHESFTPVSAAQEASGTKLLPGQEGFLAVHAQAPTGWDQKVYEGLLLRAGWYYVSSIGSPDDGFDANAEAFDITMQRFPGISSEHLIECLKHVHFIAYNRPFEMEV